MKGKLLLVATGILCAYIGTFFLVKWAKPEWLLSEDGYVSWYGGMMYPLRYTYAFVCDYERVHDGEAIFNEMDINNDKVFLKRGFIMAAYVSNIAVKQALIKTATGSRIIVHFERNLESDESFRDYFVLYIDHVERLP